MHNFGVMAQVLLTGENRFLSPRDFKELGVAKRSRSTTSARSALQQPWSIIGRTNFLKAATNLNLCRCSLPHLVRVRSVRDHHTRRQSHTASMDELACSEFMFWRSCLRLPHSRLGYPRSGLSRSDLVPWPDADLCYVSSYVGYLGQSGLVMLDTRFSESDPRATCA